MTSPLPLLVSHPLCPYVQRASIVLLEKQVPFERIDIDLAAKPDWFLALSPLGRVPVLKTEGVALFESQVIAEYLDETTPDSLHPTGPLERARHRAWIEAASAALATIARLYNAPDAASCEAAADSLRALFTRLDAEIAAPFFAGARFHMVDGAWATVFRYLDVFESAAGLGLTDGLGSLAAWRDRLRSRASVQQAAPEDYPERLTRFLLARGSHLSRLMERRQLSSTQSITQPAS